jgi:hypothetical protein
MKKCQPTARRKSTNIAAAQEQIRAEQDTAVKFSQVGVRLHHAVREGYYDT